MRIPASPISCGRPQQATGSPWPWGGFHLKDADEREITETVEELRGLGVMRMAPTHCTGDAARARFALEFGDDCIPVGVGTVIEAGG